MKPNLCTAGILLCLATVVLAQPPNIQWEATYGGMNEEECKALIQTSDGGFALAGCTFSFGAGGGDFYLVRTDANGNAIWTRTYGGSGYDHAESIVEMPDGGFVLVGCVDSTYGYAVRTNSSGNALWARTYNFALMPYWGGFSSVVRTTDNYLSVAGMTFDLVDSVGSFLLCRLDPADGDTLWTRTYQANDTLWSVCMNHIQTSDGGFALAGTVGYFDPVPPQVSEDAWLVKTDNVGNLQWSRIYGGPDNQEFHSVVEIPGVGYSMAGDNRTDVYHFYLVVTDLQGNPTVDRTYGGPNSNCRDHIRTADGGYVLAGRIYNNDPDHDGWILKTDENGDSLWSVTIGGSEYDRFYSVIQTEDFSYVLGGFTESSGNGGADMYVVQTEPDPAAVEIVSPASTPSAFTLYPAHPNPFNPMTAIRFELRAASHVSLWIYNTEGQCLEQLVAGWRAAGEHGATFDGAGLTSGIYLARLTVGETTQTQKLVLLK